MNKVIISIILLMSMWACHERSSDLDVATITGSDGRFCACCGGYFITIKSATYRFEPNEIPNGNSGINFNSADLKFPIPVLVTWKPKETQCMGDEIIVSYLIKK